MGGRTGVCADEPFAQIQPELRRRYGLPEALPGELKVAWPKKRNHEGRTPLWFLFGLALVGTGLVWNARESRPRVRFREEPREPNT
ncbi:MAG TPA: hypothetical protein ENJ18_12900 [Nannocystis exedens]|nr:hypothetical protein [Nannocystis exedens]